MEKARIILALDKILPINLLKDFTTYINKIKISYVTLLEGGLGYLKDIRKLNWDEIIFDLKLADIDSTMISIVRNLEQFADSYISHSFIGYEGALDKLKNYLDSKNKGLYLVLSMSHKGWNDDYYKYLKSIVSVTNPKGIVVGATKPVMLKLARSDFPNTIIISPGVGVQGAKIGEAICNGADYEIIGRSIYDSGEPLKTLIEFIDNQKVTINECKVRQT
ncbi:orotidine 5'-phosphate decarboxylase [Sulfolobus acidocaldarius SUSAZ]|nr:orotidine 5'-phosphate decarboxylase [Sulfolobus acidocaldarius SUSAZ]